MNIFYPIILNVKYENLVDSIFLSDLTDLVGRIVFTTFGPLTNKKSLKNLCFKKNVYCHQRILH